MCFFILSIYLPSEIKDLFNLRDPLLQTESFFFQLRKKFVNSQWWKIQKLLFSWQNPEVCLKRKNNLAFFEWIQNPDSDEMFKVFFGGFLFSKSDRFRLSFIWINFARDFFFRARFLPFVSSLQSNIRLKSSPKAICLLEIFILSSIFCKIEKLFNCSDAILQL